MRKFEKAAEERSRLRARLMARTQEGDTEACRALLDDIGPMLTNFLRRRIELHRNAVTVGRQTFVGTLKSGKNRTVVLPAFVVDALAQTATGGFGLFVHARHLRIRIRDSSPLFALIRGG